MAFTASTQIPGIADRRYPRELAGDLYPDGIRIVAESELETLLADRAASTASSSSYSDVTHEHVMHSASRAMACGADFELLGPARTQIASTRPVVGDRRHPHRRGQEPDHALPGRARSRSRGSRSS